MDRTDSKIDTQLTRGSSRVVRYELIDKDGQAFGFYPTARAAAEAAGRLWPSQRQDENRTGAGWDIQVVGS